MVGVTAGFTFATTVSRVSFRPGAAFHSLGPSSSVRFPARPWAQAMLTRFVVVVRYLPLYESEEEEKGLWGRRRLGGGGTASLLATTVPH